MAELIDAIAVHSPAAIGLDIYMPEADQTSPEQVAQRLLPQQEALAVGLRLLPGHDARLAEALHGAPTVLGAAGFQFETLATTVGMRTVEMVLEGDDPRPFLPRYPFVLASLPQLQAAAHGQALVSIEQAAIVRRVPLVAAVGAQVTPSLAMEMLRVGYNQGPIAVRTAMESVRCEWPSSGLPRRLAAMSGCISRPKRRAKPAAISPPWTCWPAGSQVRGSRTSWS
jgi:adenylate cyclase